MHPLGVHGRLLPKRYQQQEGSKQGRTGALAVQAGPTLDVVVPGCVRPFVIRLQLGQTIIEWHVAHPGDHLGKTWGQVLYWYWLGPTMARPLRIEFADAFYHVM